ncbi:DUF2157 domain-containing protein [Hahella ganghwensis]|uniref:DUF2157 domain-containing protein n=1 Tax=Hahella ganghwensis TaxID=286420 RepID=UPI000363C184|nr:DUF2157 domain-containing protein [Hahella ganghwensis]
METADNQTRPPSAPLSNFAITRERVLQLAKALGWEAIETETALIAAGLKPEATRWQLSCSRFLLVIGCALILAGITSFFAFNWADLHRFAKFTLIEAGIIGGITVAWHRGIDSLAGRAALFASAFLVGTFLAVFGQTYQTGADPYGLFLGWSILILPWVLIGRQPALWMLLAVLVNLSTILFWTEIFRPPFNDFARLLGPLTWLVFCVTDLYLAITLTLLNGAFMAVWEYLVQTDSQQRRQWMKVRWLPRITATGILTVITASGLLIIFGNLEFHRPNPHEAFVLLLFATALASILFYYQFKVIDLLILSECALALIILLTSAVARLGPADVDFALFLSLFVIIETSLAAIWLHKVSRRQEQKI